MKEKYAKVLLQHMKWNGGCMLSRISHINIPQVDFEISADAGEPGWGTADGVNIIGRIWSTPDKAKHINFQG